MLCVLYFLTCRLTTFNLAGEVNRVRAGAGIKVLGWVAVEGTGLGLVVLGLELAGWLWRERLIRKLRLLVINLALRELLRCLIEEIALLRE